MNSTSQTWSGGAEPFAMDTANDDFGNLIDFDLDNLADFPYPQSEYSQGAPAPLPDLADSIDVNLHDHFTPQLPQEHSNGLPQSGNGFFDYGMGQYSQAGTSSYTQAPEQIYRPHHAVPPTPNSVEMHGDPHRYMQQLDPQQTLFDQRYHMRKEDAVRQIA